MDREIHLDAPPGYFFQRINRQFGQAVMEYGLISAGDRILVAVSGGKDSLTLLHFLILFRKKAPVDFELLAVNLDQGQPDFPADILPRIFTDWGVEYHVERQDTYSLVRERIKPGKTPCSLCSRLRRGVLYTMARNRGCNKIALGHHRDDLIQTFLMNAFFSGKIGAMPPIYTVAEGDLRVIRPLYSVPEEWIRRFVARRGWPLIPCNVCGAGESRRHEMDELLDRLGSRYSGIRESLFGALRHPHVNQLLDRNLWSDPASANPH